MMFLKKIIQIKKLAAVDMIWIGSRIAIPEYLLGIILPLGLSVFSFYKGQTIMGIWLISIAANYVPLFIYAVNLKLTNKVEIVGRPEIAYAKKYGTQQIIILIPFLVVILAILQKMSNK